MLKEWFELKMPIVKTVRNFVLVLNQKIFFVSRDLDLGWPMTDYRTLIISFQSTLIKMIHLDLTSNPLTLTSITRAQISEMLSSEQKRKLNQKNWSHLCLTMKLYVQQACWLIHIAARTRALVVVTHLHLARRLSSGTRTSAVRAGSHSADPGCVQSC